ncbi:MAG: DNA primase [Ignavibacteria bacterium]|nr:DNA primase [Ignavibacteria bacterium]
MKIPQNKIYEISSSIDIVEVISAVTPLRKAGRSFVGRCPFHEEKTPSFSVSQEKGVYHCFGCGKSGNVFTFIMETENVTFFDSVKILAEKANIQLEFENDPYDSDRNKIDAIYEINNQAARYFHNNLTGRDGAYAMEYLTQRGLDEQTIRQFGLGYSLRDKDSLYRQFVNEFSKEDLIDSGLVLNIGADDFRDRFRGRLMFPIFNEAGKVIAFGGRRMYDETKDEAKYINSPETKIYNKSRTLYGLNFAKQKIKETGYVILVEGYMDLISLFRYGVENVVASSGTSLTNQHVKILSRYTKEAVVVFDSDLAGQNASRRAIELIIENDLSVSIIPLPQGDDPDTFIKKHGLDGFKNLLNKRQSIIEYIGNGYRDKGMLDSPERKTDFVREIIGLIAKMRDEIKRDFYIKDIAEKFAIYESIIRKELEKNSRLRSKGLTRELTPSGSELQLRIRSSVKLSIVELMLIRLLIDSDAKTKNFLMDSLEINLITDASAAKIVNYIMMNIDDPEKTSHVHLFNEFQDDRSKEIIGKALLDENYVIAGSKDKNHLNEAKQVLNQLKLMNIRSKISDIDSKIKSANEYTPETLELLNLQQNLKKEQVELEKGMKSI